MVGSMAPTLICVTWKYLYFVPGTDFAHKKHAACCGVVCRFPKKFILHPPSRCSRTTPQVFGIIHPLSTILFGERRRASAVWILVIRREKQCSAVCVMRVLFFEHTGRMFSWQKVEDVASWFSSSICYGEFISSLKTTYEESNTKLVFAINAVVVHWLLFITLVANNPA